jgi:hypothetical protein
MGDGVLGRGGEVGEQGGEEAFMLTVKVYQL